MIKKLLLITGLLLTTNVWADLNNKFGVSCKVTDQIVMGMEEGISKRYGGFEGGLDIGDSFYIEWGAFQLGERLLSITVEIEDLDTFTTKDSHYRPEYNSSFYFDSSLKGRKGTIFSLTDSTIMLNKTGRGNAQIVMIRYYKNDWNFILTRRVLLQNHTLHANCMGMPEEYDQLISLLEKKYGKRANY